MKLILLWLVSWGIGLLTYVTSLALIYRQTLSSGDLTSVVISSLLAFGLAFTLVYLPVLRALRRWLNGVRPAWPFPASAVLLGVLPTAMIALFYGGGVRALFQPEAILFFALFAASGIALGVGFVFLYPDGA